MRKLLLLLLLSVSALAQKPMKVTVTLPDSVAGQGWVKNQILQAIKDITKPPTPGLDSCGAGAGPIINNIYDISTAGVTTLYHGENIFKIGWQVSNLSGQVLRSGDFVPVNNTPSVKFDPVLTPGIYNLTYWSLSCASKPSTKSFTINGPPVGLDSCKRGPTIEQIQIVSATYLKVLYDGEGIKDIAWSIKTDRGAQVRDGSLIPVNNTPELNFAALSAGDYTLYFTSKLCIAKGSSKGFTVQGDTGGGGVDPLPGTWVAKTVTTGFPRNMDITISGDPGNYILNDVSPTSVPPAGYVFQYQINADKFRQSTPLKNYKYQSNNPLRILKVQIKDGIDESGLNHWATQPSDTIGNAYYSMYAGREMSENESVAFHTKVFTSDTKTSFVNPIPTAYNPSTQFVQWADIAGDLKLPSGHFFVLNRGEWGIDQVLSRGITNIPNGQLPWPNTGEVDRYKNAGKSYNDVPRTEAIFGLNRTAGDDQLVNDINIRWWPNGELTQQQAIDKGNSVDAGHALWIGETLEGESRMPMYKSMWRYFYETLRARYERNFGARGIPYYICHNYFQLWGGDHLRAFNLGSLGMAADKRTLSLPADQLPSTDFSPGGTMSKTNLIVEGVYLGAPDVQTGELYESLFRMTLFKNMGYSSGIFLFPVHEWRPNQYYKIPYADGTYYSANKMPLDPSVLISYGFLGQVYGKGMVIWGDPGKQSPPKLFGDDQWTHGIWYPNGSENQAPFPYKTNSGSPYYAYSGGSDLAYFSQKLFTDTYAKVEGGKDQYLKFKLDNGDWYSAENVSANDIVNAYYGKRGFVHSRTLNGVTAWFYINSFADNLAHKLTITLPNGTTTTETVAGNGIHVKVIL